MILIKVKRVFKYQKILKTNFLKHFVVFYNYSSFFFLKLVLLLNSHLYFVNKFILRTPSILLTDLLRKIDRTIQDLDFFNQIMISDFNLKNRNLPTRNTRKKQLKLTFLALELISFYSFMAALIANVWVVLGPKILFDQLFFDEVPSASIFLFFIYFLKLINQKVHLIVVFFTV